MAADEVLALIDEVRLVFHAAAAATERLHADVPVTVGMRAVLEYLAAHGPAPVPVIARARGVSRQHVQTLANALLERGLAETRDNPAHRRSVLLAPTPAGSTLIRELKTRERAFVDEHLADLDAASLVRARATLGRLRAHLEST